MDLQTSAMHLNFLILAGKVFRTQRGAYNFVVPPASTFRLMF